MNDRPVTLATLRRLKAAGEPIAVLTAYDAAFARLLDEAGVEVLLVGDSLGMVIQGRDSTVPVTVEDMAYHTRCVAAGRRRAFLVADLPFLACATWERAVDSAGELMRAGAQMVKLEAGPGAEDLVARLAREGVPVCAHLGLLPQRVHQLGGYRVQGREADQAEALFQQALALEAAGAGLLLLECVPAELARRIREAVTAPVIGIGAGPHCDGQVLVLYDLIGLTRGPSFSRDFLAGRGSLREAVAAYVAEVKAGRFPSPGETPA